MINLRSPWRRHRWGIRFVLWGFAALAGLTVVGFSELASVSLDVFFSLYQRYWWSPFLLAPGVAMLTVFLTQRFFPGSQGSGIPQVIAATQLARQNKPVSRLVSFRILIGKVFLGCFVLIGGFSAGREGPSVQVAASIMAIAHRFLPHARALRKADLILAGGAAGIAAAFNTPLAGIVFAVEELGRRLETRTSGVLISTIILSGLVSIALLGDYRYFGRLSMHEAVSLSIIPSLLFSAVICGLLGALFNALLLWPQRSPHHALWQWRRSHPIAFAGLCGVLIAILGVMVKGASFGSGYGITKSIIEGHQNVSWDVPITRFLATVITYFAGMPGGIFAPALSVGAALGYNLSHFVGSFSNAVPLITLCMAGFLAAVTQAPITSSIIVMEMVDGHALLISLMAVSLIAKGVSSRFSGELYQVLGHYFYHNTLTELNHQERKTTVNPSDPVVK
ncbi:MAG: chloride channel protein [Betaproteobacteria bacterium]|nr:chloride channel protein [Betaproteobacteria bacterium]